jgi:hypothetical protein
MFGRGVAVHKSKGLEESKESKEFKNRRQEPELIGRAKTTPATLRVAMRAWFSAYRRRACWLLAPILELLELLGPLEFLLCGEIH